jgi:sec-independent protein translocase protein TatA
MPFGIGTVEIVIILIFALVIFGPKRLPELGRSLGRGIREFRGSISGEKRDDEDAEPPELERSQQDSEAEAVEGEVVTQKRA